MLNNLKCPMQISLLAFSKAFSIRQHRTASQGEILCKRQLQSPLPLPKQPNLVLLSGRLTSSNILALGVSHSSSVQRLFYCSVLIAITSWAPDVVNLVRPI